MSAKPSLITAQLKHDVLNAAGAAIQDFEALGISHPRAVRYVLQMLLVAAATLIDITETAGPQ